ncbi:RNA polymerase sigma factor [Qipengyuania sp.]|uniref:RNA polymerase sigma factor n=1 Tax=Qipengyuania sp. TaxID=2004515 RepID=UPI003734F8C6
MGSVEGEPDSTLVSAAAGGDRAALARLLERHYERIRSLAWQVTGSRSDADDIAQEVCCTLVTKIADFRGEAKFTTWLFAIVLGHCSAHRRRSSAIRRLTQGLGVIVGLAAAPDGRDAYDAAWLKSAIARLKPDLRETVALVVGQQLTHGEAAEVLGVAESTVSWRMHEVRRHLAGPGRPAP